MQEKRQDGGAAQPVEVEIGGKAYRLRGSDPAQLRRLAREVDAALGELTGGEALGDNYKVAVLAALNLAAEHDERKKRWRAALGELDGRAAQLESRLDELSQRLAREDRFCV